MTFLHIWQFTMEKSVAGRENSQLNSSTALNRTQTEGKGRPGGTVTLRTASFTLGQVYSGSHCWGSLSSIHSSQRPSIHFPNCWSPAYLLAGWDRCLCFLQSQTCHRREEPSGLHSGNSSCYYIPLGQTWGKTSRRDRVRTRKSKDSLDSLSKCKTSRISSNQHHQ